MVYVISPILIGDNQRKYSSHQPWIHGTSLMWALHVWSCVTDFSSLTALLGYLVTCKIRAHSPSPDGRYQIICNFVRTCYEPLDYANFIFDRCVAARLCQQTRFIVPVESAGANRVPIVPEDSGSHRHRALLHTGKPMNTIFSPQPNFQFFDNLDYMMGTFPDCRLGCQHSVLCRWLTPFCYTFDSQRETRDFMCKWYSEWTLV